jgi:hypothetical protein
MLGTWRAADVDAAGYTMTMRGWPRRGRRIDGSCAALLFGEEQAPSFYSSPIQSSPARIPVEAPTCRAMDAVRELEVSLIRYLGRDRETHRLTEKLGEGG